MLGAYDALGGRGNRRSPAFPKLDPPEPAELTGTEPIHFGFDGAVRSAGGPAFDGLPEGRGGHAQVVGRRLEGDPAGRLGFRGAGRGRPVSSGHLDGYTGSHRSALYVG